MAIAKQEPRHNGVIHIVQIWQDTDLRAGEPKLRKILNAERNMRLGEVVIFMNRKRNKIKVLGHIKGMYCECVSDRETYDFVLRREKIIDAVGTAFGLKLYMPRNVNLPSFVK